MSLMKEFTKGIFKENPIFVIMLGMCPTLAVSTSVQNAIGMGLAATFVLVASNVLISLIRNFIPNKIRIPCYITVIAAFVTIVDLSMKAWFPALSKSLGIFIPLIVVNCIILGRAEAFANKNTVLASLLDGVGMGVGFTLALMLLAFFRELLGTGKVLDITILPASIYNPALIMILPAGAFLALGAFMGFFAWKKQMKEG